MGMKLPAGARFEIEMQWGSIGWAVPASFGYAVGAASRRTVAMIGDGSFQLIAQEVAQMIRRKLPITIFLMNNHGCTIEVDGAAGGDRQCSSAPAAIEIVARADTYERGEMGG